MIQYDILGVLLISFLYVCLHLCAWSLPLYNHSSTNLVVQMERRILFVIYSCNVRSIIPVSYTHLTLPTILRV